MAWGESRRIVGAVWLVWAAVVLWGVRPLCAQPMPWPADLAEEPKPAGSSEEQPPAPSPPAESPAAKPASPPGAEPAAPPSKEIRELKPSLYYLKDKQGNLQPVPGFTLEEFRELYELKHLLEEKAQPPGYSVQSLDIQGEVRGARAELSIEVRVSVRETPVRIPLRLEGLVIRKFEGVPEPPGSEPTGLQSQTAVPETKPDSSEAKSASSASSPPSQQSAEESPEPKPKGPPQEGSAETSGAKSREAKTEYLLQWEEGEGYGVWILGAPEWRHRLRFQGAAAIQQVGQQSRLRFRCVRAPVSQMKLRLPGQGLKVEASDPAALVEMVSVSESASQLKLEGFGGNVELVWYPESNLPVASVSALDVTGEAVARLEGEKIVTQTNLFIKVLGQPCHEVDIRLPDGVKLHPISQPGCTYTQETSDRIKLHFLEKASEHRVRLEWEQRPGNRAGENWLELGGLEVLGAVKHRGYIAVWGPGRGHLLWRASASVRQTEQLPPSLLGEGLLAGFEYTSQPYSLQVRLVSQQVRVSVEPEYRLWVSAREVKLEGFLKYTIRGGKVQGLRVEMPGWELEELSPEEVVGEGVLQADNHVVEIPLKQPTGGHLDMRLAARRAILAGTKQLVLPLPQGWQVLWPPGGTVSLLPASVVVIPEDNVELRPDEKQMSGWVRQGAPNLSGLPKRQQPILAYRAESGAGVFAAGLRVHERQVRVAGAAQILVDEEGVQVEQKLSYTIAYEMLGALTVWAPPAVAPESLEVLVDAQPASAAPISALAKRPEDVGPVQLAIPLPQPRIGSCDLSVRYRLKSEKLPVNQTQLRSVPLVVPAEGEWLGWRVTVAIQEGLQVNIRSDRWKELESLAEPPGPLRRLLVGCTEPASELPLGVYRESADLGRPLRISRAFVQTWWTRSGREDRAIYRLSGSRREFAIRLPEGANAEEVAVWVNGQPAPIQVESGGRLVVALPPATEEWVVELAYHFEEFRPPRGLLQVGFPQPEPLVWMERCYWMGHLPRDEHLLLNPRGFVPEYQWRWNGWSWGRVPRWTPADLEVWAGARPAGLNPEGLNTYLFSTIGRLETASIYTVGRSVLVLTASLAALGLGLLVIYVRALRHPVWILGAGIGLGASALLWPEQTVLGIQAAVLGVILAVVAAMLQRRIAARQMGTAHIAAGLLDQESTQRQYLPPPPATTGSAHLRPPVSASTASPDIAS